jgi:ankyrin repeat protein
MKKWGIIFSVCLFILIPKIIKAQEDINIYECINKEDVNCISEYLMSGFDVDDRDGSGNSLLLIATGLGKEKIVEYLIKQGASVDLANYEGVSPLHKAAQIGRTAIIDMLLNAGAFVNNLDLDGMTPLMFAVGANNRFTVEQLLKRGALIEMKNVKGENARQIAVRLRHYEIVKFFDNEASKIKPKKKHKYSWEE